MSSRARLRLAVILFLFIVSSIAGYCVFAQEQTGNLVVAFLDVGQGDAIYIKSPAGNDMLIDGGRADGRVLAGLADVMFAADRRINVVLATHPDADHIGGLPEVLSRFVVDSIIVSGNTSDTGIAHAFEQSVQDEGAAIIRGTRGTVVDLGGGVLFTILFPDRDPSGWESNTASIVGLLTFGSTSVLLTGDSPDSVEDYLASRYGARLDVDVLKLGHHGSDTSSSKLFLKTVSPQYAVVSAGKDNQYGHPAPSVIDRVLSAGSCIFTTIDSGHVIFYSNGNEWQTSGQCVDLMLQDSFDKNKK